MRGRQRVLLLDLKYHYSKFKEAYHYFILYIVCVCSAKDLIRVTRKFSGSHEVVEVNTGNGTMLVCGGFWDMAAANVVCRDTNPK